jgi:4-carboxymuconolactone decarboxylase
MDRKTHDKGLEIRKAVLGEAYVNDALKNVDNFNKPFQELVTEYCWGAVWGREELPRKTRSMLNLSIYAGIPAGVDSFRIAREVFAELDQA